MLVQGGDTIIYPISFSTHYSLGGIVQGYGATGIIQINNNSFTGCNAYCVSSDGRFWSDYMYLIGVGI